MKLVRTLLLFLVVTFVWGANTAQAQELNCQVQVIKPTIQTSNQQIFDDLQRSVFEFMNNTKWTTDVYSTQERIECTMVITVTEFLNGNFKASIQVSSSRPIYNSTYRSQVLNVNDADFQFQYLQNTAIEFAPNEHRQNLASVLAFYAYVIIGADFDTYSLEGGTPHYVKAQQIVNNASNAPQPGWKAFEGTQNRYWLIDNVLHQRFKPLRQCAYNYHRLGFDKLYDDMEGGRAQITQSLDLLKKVHQARPGSYNMQLFFLAKADEIVNLYSEGLPQEKTRIFNLLKTVDAVRADKYQKIMKGS